MGCPSCEGDVKARAVMLSETAHSVATDMPLQQVKAQVSASRTSSRFLSFSVISIGALAALVYFL
jgi:hypothetical protein